MISVSISPPNLDIATQWNELVRRASPNVFMNPAALCAATETGFAKVHMLLAWNDDVSPPRLVGIWALGERRIAPFCPAVLDALPYNYAFLSSPVIDPDFTDVVVGAFFNAIAGDRSLPRVIHLALFDRAAPSFAAIQGLVRYRGGAQLVLAGERRPCVSKEFGLKRSGSTRKKLRQDWNRLSAQGIVEVVNVRAPDEVQQAFEIFLALEQASWKGAHGTALLCDAKDAAFVRQLIANLSASGEASVALLRVDGRAIAAQVLMYCGSSAYTWKTAFDAAFARYSPGALLVDKVTEQLLGMPGIESIDSCSAETGFMAHLWTGRQAIVDAVIDIGPGRSMAYLLAVLWLAGYQRARGLRDRWRSRTQNKPPLASEYKTIIPNNGPSA
ncbi:MAG TPA: GNAT family N-acetyltransferase [Xanthobacteraceae bacterium]|jgi:hypothetical protein